MALTDVADSLKMEGNAVCPQLPGHLPLSFSAFRAHSGALRGDVSPSGALRIHRVTTTISEATVSSVFHHISPSFATVMVTLEHVDAVQKVLRDKLGVEFNQQWLTVVLRHVNLPSNPIAAANQAYKTLLMCDMRLAVARGALPDNVALMHDQVRLSLQRSCSCLKCVIISSL